MKKHGILWWLFIGWWWVPATLPIRILIAICRAAAKQKPAATAAPCKPVPGQKEEKHKVAGVSSKQDVIKAMGVKNLDYAKTKSTLKAEGLTDRGIYEYIFRPQKVELVPEPDNPEDPKAIKVVVDGQHIGYIKAGSCAHIHKLIREERILGIRCWIGGGKSKTLVCYAVDADANADDYELEQDNSLFNAQLTLTVKTDE